MGAQFWSRRTAPERWAPEGSQHPGLQPEAGQEGVDTVATMSIGR